MVETLGANAQGFSFALEESQGRLQLRALHRPDYRPIHADWQGDEMLRRIAGGRKQLLARAIGLNKTRELSVLDATAGLGGDGYTLAALGATVTMLERQPQIYALLQDAHRRAAINPDTAEIAGRITVLATDARHALAGGCWDVAYLDPMYPHTGKAALPRREMQIFRELTSGDPDAGLLLESAMRHTFRRIVVKRSAKAPFLAGREPTYSLSGSQTRFDVYISPGHTAACTA